jgi:hypothetical protein
MASSGHKSAIPSSVQPIWRNYQFIVSQFEKEGGLFPFPIRQHTGTARLDHWFNNNNQAFVRYTFPTFRNPIRTCKLWLAFLVALMPVQSFPWSKNGTANIFKQFYVLRRR